MKVCDAADSFNSVSLSDEIVSVETWDLVCILNVPSRRIYPSLFTGVEVQITPIICAGISDKMQLITWSSLTYTFAAGFIVITGVECDKG